MTIKEMALKGAELWDWLADNPGKSKGDAAEVFPEIKSWRDMCAACAVAAWEKVKNGNTPYTCFYCPIGSCMPEYRHWWGVFTEDKFQINVGIIAARALADKHRAWAEREKE